MKLLNVKSVLTLLGMFVSLIVISSSSDDAATISERSMNLINNLDENKLQTTFYMYNEWYDEELEESLLSDEDDDILNLIEIKEQQERVLENTKNNLIDDGKMNRNFLYLFHNKATEIDKKYKYVVDSKSGMIYKHDTGKSIPCSIMSEEVLDHGEQASTLSCHSLTNYVQSNIHVVCSPIQNACVVSNLETLLAQQIDQIENLETGISMSTSDDDFAPLSSSSPPQHSLYFTIFNEVHSESNGESLACLSNNNCDKAAMVLNKPLYCGSDGYCKVGAREGDIYCELNMDCFEAGSYHMKCDYETNNCVEIKKPITKNQYYDTKDSIISHIVKKASFTQQVLLGVSLALATVSGFIFFYEWLKVGNNENNNSEDIEEEEYLYQNL
jgi:hypothetical protein